MVPSRPDRQRQVGRAAAILGLVIAAGCGGSGGSPQATVSVATEASASAAAEREPAAAAARPATVQASLDAEATGYDRIDAPAGGKSTIGAAAIVAAQAAFDSVGDVVSR